MLPTEKEEHENFTRLKKLVFQVGLPRLRELFVTRYSQNHGKWEETPEFGEKLLKTLDEQKNKSQEIELLKNYDERQSIQSGKLSKWDYTILQIILTHFQFDSSTSYRFEIENKMVHILTEVRNKIARDYLEEEKIPNEEFIKLWNKTWDSCLYLGAEIAEMDNIQKLYQNRSKRGPTSYSDQRSQDKSSSSNGAGNKTSFNSSSFGPSSASQGTNERLREKKRRISDSDDNIMPSHVESDELNLNINISRYNLRSKDPPVLSEDDDDDDADKTPKRVQQPRAYINPNLMKVKMESDYVPVIAIKTEPDQDMKQVEMEHENNDNENANENSSSAPEPEIQMNLQNKIEQLNLIIGQQQAKIIDLNSSITQQRDENNLLNAQVNQQQDQIEELENKLKLFVENPKSGKVQIADLSTEVLSRIFDYLDIKSLKEFRLVCRQWRNEAGKILLKNFYLKIGGIDWCEKSLQSWLTNSYFTATAQKLKSEDGGKTLQLLRKLPRLRCSVRELRFLVSSTSRSEHLYEILQLLPKIQVLETSMSALSLSNGIRIKLELIKKLQTLKKLKLRNCLAKADLTQFFHHYQQFASIKNIEIHAAMFFIKQFLYHSKNINVRGNWTITRFTLEVHQNYNVELIRSFLLKISPSLQHLTVKLFTTELKLLSPSVSRYVPWKDDWIIPIGLNKVETLEIERTSNLGNQLVVKSILVALGLRRLKKLTVDYIPMELEEIIHNWNSHESANGYILKSKSLQELELLKFMNPVKIPGNLWPGLKSLKCSRINPSCFELSVLGELRNLERLELEFGWLLKRVNVNQSSLKFHLRDLKNLKSLYLKVPGNEQCYKDWANLLVEKDLKFMKSLQSVQFDGVVIDAEPLKTALGPNVSIIFSN